MASVKLDGLDPKLAEQQMRNLMDSFGGPVEELCDELKAALVHDGPMGTCIKHPLYYSMVHAPEMNRLANLQFAAKKQAVEEALAEGRWGAFVWLHERPYRLDAFEQIMWRIGPHLYWDLLGGIWTDSENVYQNYSGWRECLTADAPCRWKLMDGDERAKWRRLRRRKTPIPVFRGFATDGGEEGMSWTLSYDRARWFALRLAGVGDRDHPRVIHALVDGKNIIACFDGRGEEEVVLLPEDTVQLKVEEVDFDSEA